PAKVGFEQKPMIWPYLRTGSPAAMSASATLCPSAIGSRTPIVRPARLRKVPLGIGPAATAALSSSLSTTAPAPSAAIAIPEALQHRPSPCIITASLVSGPASHQLTSKDSHGLADECHPGPIHADSDRSAAL